MIQHHPMNVPKKMNLATTVQGIENIVGGKKNRFSCGGRVLQFSPLHK